MASYTTPAEARRRAVRGLLLQLGGYGALNTSDILRHLDTHGSLLTCPYIRLRHRAACNALVARHNARAMPEPEPFDWQDGWRWHLGPEPTRSRRARRRLARAAIQRLRRPVVDVATAGEAVAG